MYDVMVIGCGPAGLSAAVNVRQRGGSVICVGTAKENNPLWKAERIDNYLGMPSVTGSQMMEAFIEHARSMGVEMKKERVLNAFYTGDHWMMSAGADVLEAYAVVFAGGISRGKTWPGEEEYVGRGVSYCATCDGMLYRGKDVAVIGYGSADKEEAEYLEQIGCRTVYREKPKTVRIIGEKKVSAVEVDSETIPCECVFILRPSLAASSLFPGIELNGSYLKTDEDMATNLPGLYAAGDCTGRPLQVARAVGQGLVAGQKAMEWASNAKK